MSQMNCSKALFIALLQAIYCVASGKNARIVGGVDVPNDLYPWFARSTTIGAICGGVLIAPQYVLTAAHCVMRQNVWENGGGFQIGGLCKGNDNPDNCGQDSEYISSLWAIQHPDFDFYDLANDFALVKLSETSSIEPANIDESGVSNSYEEFSTTDDLWAVGFGLLSANSMNLPTHLQHVDVGYISNDTCASKYKGFVFDSKSMLCAASPGKDACSGDSGGPLYDKKNDLVVGLTSWGIGCASKKHPGVYSRISHGFQWIKETICNDEDTIKPNFCYCNSLENNLLLHATNMSKNSKLIFKMRSNGKLRQKKKFKNKNGKKYYCLPRDECVNVVAVARSGEGSFSISLNGKEYIHETFENNSRSIRRLSLPCSTRSAIIHR